jgi:hypothetical protein
VIEQRVLVSPERVPLVIESPDQEEEREAVEEAVNPGRRDPAGVNRAFWQRFIDEVAFDHPDQPPPRHGGNNWVKITMPAPATWLTGYRLAEEFGFFLNLAGEEGRAAFKALRAEADVLQEESGFEPVFTEKAVEPFKGSLTFMRPLAGVSEDEQIAWLKATANRLASLLRPRLALLAKGEGRAKIVLQEIM